MVALGQKNNGMDYKNVLGIGITDLLLIVLSCHGFLKNNDSVVILKCPNRMSEYYFNKWYSLNSKITNPLLK